LATAIGENVRLGSWHFENLINEACSRLPRNFTKEEWQDYMGDESYQLTCPNLPGDSFESNAMRFLSNLINLFRYGYDTDNSDQVSWPKW
jgi:hypothetical protein